VTAFKFENITQLKIKEKNTYFENSVVITLKKINVTVTTEDSFIIK